MTFVGPNLIFVRIDRVQHFLWDNMTLNSNFITSKMARHITVLVHDIYVYITVFYKLLDESCVDEMTEIHTLFF
jgi:hypothetical protein